MNLPPGFVSVWFCLMMYLADTVAGDIFSIPRITYSLVVWLFPRRYLFRVREAHLKRQVQT